MNWSVIVPLIRLIAYPAIAVLSDRFLQHWQELEKALFPHASLVTSWMIAAVMHHLEGPLKSWIKLNQ